MRRSINSKPKRWQLGLIVLVGLLLAVGLLTAPLPAGAHADIESSIPAADSTVESAPLTLDLTFTEEVTADGVTVRVIGPDGGEAQSGTAELDLNDPDRRHVTLSLQANLPAGRYTVEWETTSNLDDHVERGSFAFTVGGASASPAASPASIGAPVGTPGAVAGSVQPESTLDPGANGNPLSATEDDFDGGAFGLSVAAGLVGAVAIFLVWRAVRPRNPVFGGRARG